MGKIYYSPNLEAGYPTIFQVSPAAASYQHKSGWKFDASAGVGPKLSTTNAIEEPVIDTGCNKGRGRHKCHLSLALLPKPQLNHLPSHHH